MARHLYCGRVVAVKANGMGRKMDVLSFRGPDDALLHEAHHALAGFVEIVDESARFTSRNREPSSI